MIIYCDGSYYQSHEVATIGFGLVVHSKQRTYELSGIFKNLPAKKIECCHEWVALYESILFASSRGMQPSEVSIYSDCMDFEVLKFRLNPNNFKSTGFEKKFMTKLKLIYGAAFDEARLKYWVYNTRVHFTKSHNACVDQSRADHLAGQKNRGRPITPRDEWLQGGFFKYNEKGEPSKWFPPFLKISNKELEQYHIRNNISR